MCHWLSRNKRPISFLLCILFGSQLAAEEIRFNRDIRPILSENCFFCHGQDPKQRKAGLRLDQRAEAIKDNDGVFAIVPGQPEKSEVMRLLLSHNADEKMPPADSHRQVTPDQIQQIRRWIAQGAHYEKHWAYVPPVKSPIPAVSDKKWARKSWDGFILAKLDTHKLKPSPEASPSTWLRRASFDLTGLPPSPAEIRSFEIDVAQGKEAAYLEAAERLLASPRFGERLAQEWLDVSRYADTHGFNNDSTRSMWRWRDWVIGAFNANMPFDRFITEQLAGDLLPNPTLEQRLATAFNRNHVINSEGGIIDEEYRVEYVADRVRTTSTALLGLTTECARCHDHKFDPITQKDYYRLFAFFNNVSEYGEDGRVANAVPFLVTPTHEQQNELAQIDAELAHLDSQMAADKITTPSAILIDELRPKLAAEDAKLKPKLLNPNKPNESEIAAKNADIDPKRGTTLTVWFKPKSLHDNAPILSALDRSLNPAATEFGNGRELRIVDNELEWISSLRYPTYATIIRTTGAFLRADTWHHVAIHIQGKEDAASVSIFVDGEEVPTKIRHNGISKTPANRNWQIGIAKDSKPFHGMIEGFSVYPSILNPAQIRQSFWLHSKDKISAKRETHTLLRQLNATKQTQRDTLWAKRLALTRNLPTTMVMEELPTVRKTYVLNRGVYDARGIEVHPGIPEELIAPWPKGAPMNRLGLAQWFLQPQHPLTARVVVNRFWAQLFGVGLVKSVEDFGTQGEWPSHPELLDTLARDFIDEGWNVKAFFKSVVLSSTYRQTSNASPALYARDPDNRLLARGPRLRLPAEQIRDQALAISGLLVEKLGGPSVRPYQPEGLYKGIVVDAPYPSTTWDIGKGSELYRRSLYTFWKRTIPHPAMLTLDAPDREFCTARRSRTNTPLQALVLWNETGYFEASRKLGERMLKEGGTNDNARTSFAFQLATGHSPTATETAILTRTLSKMRADYTTRPADASKMIQIGTSQPDPTLDPVELAAATCVANLILSLDETITKN